MKPRLTSSPFDALNGQRYGVIYADPPWYKNPRSFNATRFGGGASGHYDLMRTQDICALPVGDLAADNCILFLWACWPDLLAALEVIEAWGFRYATLGFNWFKTDQRGNPCFGVGYYTKSNSEVCLLGVRGSMKPAVDTVSQVIVAPRREHSRKPDQDRYLIEKMYPDVPKLELFARERAEGWDAWGDQVDLRPAQKKLF